MLDSPSLRRLNVNHTPHNTVRTIDANYAIACFRAR